MLNISDGEIKEVVTMMRSQVVKYGQSPVDIDELIDWISEISTRATITLLEEKTGKNSVEIIDNMVFPTTFVEWANTFHLKTHFDKFLAAALYLRQQKEINIINTTEISQMYQKARWKKPANMADTFAKAAEKHFFVEMEEDTEEGLKAWQMTRTGYEYLVSLRGD